MQNLAGYKKELILLFTGLSLLVIALLASLVPQEMRTRGSEIVKTTPTPDPRKEFKSLDNFITYTFPPAWQKEDYVDEQFGQAAYISLKSPDYNSPETFIINSGIGITISRTYDPAAEETLRNKLNAQYQSYVYNVLPIKIAGKNSMTMHQDYEGHHRLIYISNGSHLWQITIASKSLEDESRYQGDIENFLNSIRFKD